MVNSDEQRRYRANKFPMRNHSSYHNEKEAEIKSSRSTYSDLLRENILSENNENQNKIIIINTKNRKNS